MGRSRKLYMGADKDGEVIMQETTTIGLQKPEENEYIDLEILNANFDKIDEAIAEVSKNKIQVGRQKQTEHTHKS